MMEDLGEDSRRHGSVTQSTRARGTGAGASGWQTREISSGDDLPIRITYQGDQKVGYKRCDEFATR